MALLLRMLRGSFSKWLSVFAVRLEEPVINHPRQLKEV